LPDAADYEKAIAELKRARRIVFTTHVKPDGDGLGGIAALRTWLQADGTDCETVVPTPFPEKYGFLDGGGPIRVVGRDVDLASLDPPDLVCVVDTGTWQQLGDVRPLLADSGATVLVIDHHRTQDPLADVSLVDAEAAACATLVHRLLGQAGAEMTPAMAGYLLAALGSDTGWFSLPNTDATTFRLATAMVEAGARPDSLYEQLYLNQDLTAVRLRGQAIDAMRPALDGRVMVIRLPEERFRRVGASKSNTENVINECLKVRGVDVGVLLVEGDAGRTCVSLRSRPGIHVLPVAERFGGGGHARAAGMTVEAGMDEAEATVLAAIEEILS
jgi:phosphoesterase RecJ-like protein